MDGHIQHGVTDDYFDAVLTGDGVLVRMSDNVASTLAHLANRLIRLLEAGEIEKERAGLLRRAISSDTVLHRMFPDAYRDRAAAQDFRSRHAALLRDTEAPRRVHARCISDTVYVIPHAEVDDWLVTMALARFLVLPRKAARLGVTGTWLNYVLECLAVAVNPSLANQRYLYPG